MESYENFNDLSCLTKLLTDRRQNREGLSAYNGEDLRVPGNTVPVVLGATAFSNNAAVDVSPFAVNAITGTSGSSLINGKFESLKYPFLGGAIILSLDYVNAPDSLFAYKDGTF